MALAYYHSSSSSVKTKEISEFECNSADLEWPVELGYCVLSVAMQTISISPSMTLTGVYELELSSQCPLSPVDKEQ